MNIATTKPFVPSPQQAVVIEWVKNGRGSAFIEAVAGAGKTTTLVHALGETKGSVAFAAYNKKIAREIETKVAKLNMGNRVRVGTFHSFGFGAWRRVHPRVKAGPDAVREKADRTWAALEVPKSVQPIVGQLVSLAKNRALGLIGAIDDDSKWWDIVDHFDLAHDVEDPAMLEGAIEYAQEAIKFHRDIGNEIIDFDDMIWLPIVTGCRMWENDWVFTDEAQDTNPARRAMVRKMLRRGGRAAFVGDRHQAIYGFTGADNDAVDQIVKDFSCCLLPLTTTYRCPKEVVRLAQTVVSHIQAHSSAPEGVVRRIEAKDIIGEGLEATDAVLCRKTAPLVEMAYGLIRKGIACHVEGKDIGVGLLKLANKWQVRDLDDLRDRLEAYRVRETEKLIAKGRDLAAEALADRIETLLVLMDGCLDVNCVRQKITSMFMDTTGEETRPTLTLSTVHKAKGREWQRVFVLGGNLWMPHPMARQAWAVEQERNLIYVAYTRAQHELVLVDVEAA